jgi:preprotein translocase subunit SecD
MKIRWQRFNLYLLMTLAVAAAAACGCQNTGHKKPERRLSTLRLHLEVSRNGVKASEPVPVYRAEPVWVNVDKTPFLDEGHVSSVEVVEVVGGFALRIQFDHRGTTLLEECTTTNRGRRIAIFSQFGEQLKDSRWLAAPIISRRISDGAFIFTPDTTREEAEEIARGLNYISKRVHTWIEK